RAEVPRRPCDRRVEPGLLVGLAVRIALPAARRDPHGRQAGPEGADHSQGNRARPGRRAPRRVEPRDRRLGEADLRPPVRGDERLLERLLRVDVVGNDLYDIRGKAEWAANEELYNAHPGKPYSFPEWGLWGIDDPVFVKTMSTFVRTHRRTEMLSYF